MPRYRAAFLMLVIAGAMWVAGCREDGDIQISGLTFNGVKQVDKDALANALQTKQGSWIPWSRKRFFDRRAFEADLKRIEAFYRDRGFPDARVRSFDVKLNDAQDKVDVTLDITEGEPIRVAAIEMRGFDVLPPDRQKTLHDTLPLRPEQPVDRQLLIASRERALNALRDEGYPYAEVTVSEEEAGARALRVVLDATPGVLAHFGEVDVRGYATVSEEVIRRQLTFKPGDRYARQDLRDSQRQLYGLELFEFANIEPLEEPVLMNEEVPVRVTVAEGKQQRIMTGIGYGTEEQARARIRWEHRNLFGGAQKGGVEAKWSSLDRGVRADYRQPYFLSSRMSLNFDAQAWQAAEPVYSTEQLGGRVLLRHQPNAQNFWTIGLTNEYQRSTIDDAALRDLTIRDDLIALGLDPTTGESSGTLSAITFDVTRDTTNSLLNATRGYRVAGHVEQAGKWLWGTYNFWSATAEGRHFATIANRLTIANRIRIGSIVATGGNEANVPFYRRFYLGGSSSIRGWGRFDVSPLEQGFPIGGLSMVEGSSELRLPLAGKFGVAAFFDFGNVWRESWNVDLRDLRYAVGPGLRYQTPIGPARFDVGYQLNPIEGLLVNGEPQKRRFRLHFSIGQAF
ncbi:MAG TPA: BamA/TamA family outer membrane protein [Vicinamibacterales bacterium]|nr:BamA/TamA family outer membrane protein [Vicinamibacterales bacterium]